LDSNVLVSVRLPEEVVEAIDSLVRSGVVECRSDVLRLAVILKLRSMGYPVESEELSRLLSKLGVR
jgi:Arc/MetJ-type ribon-helix-helix transcriptional regulator